MKQPKLTVFFAVTLAATLCFGAGHDEKNRKDAKPSKVVDSGSFGIFINGKRIGTETFRIEQGAEYGVASSQIKVDDGSGSKAEQNSEMQVMSNGNLRQYSWHSTVPVKEESIVEPKDEFLVEHVTFADQRKQDVPYVLPLATVILDDNFFSHREILLWRYLAACERKQDQISCAPTKFGVLVPHQHASGNTSVALVGRDKTTIKGVQKELNKVQMDADGVQWVLWVDDTYMVVKMEVPSSNVEVVRD
ncbi:MAG TPA: hypothetical protein VFK06_23345 [Candidatus Angelobacter sp.]|nr:hypothetical protein [Candidatus Angelobacter sp.]